MGSTCVAERMVWNAGSSQAPGAVTAGGCDDCRRLMAELLGWGLIVATLAGWAWVVVMVVTAMRMNRGDK